MPALPARPCEGSSSRSVDGICRSVIRRVCYALGVLVVIAVVVLGVVLVNGLLSAWTADPADPSNPRACSFTHANHVHPGLLIDGECRLGSEPHDASTVHSDVNDDDFLGYTVDPAELKPSARGEPPPPFAVFHEQTGERGGALMPPPTPAVIEWSDWCFFGPEGAAPAARPYDCSLEMAHFAAAITYLGADEECVLEQHRLRIEAAYTPATLPGDAVDAYGWHRCPSVIDPSPEPGADWATGCGALVASDPLVAEYVTIWEGDCNAWADTQQTRMAKVPEWLRAPDCERADELSYLWIQAHHGDDAPSGVSRC